MTERSLQVTYRKGRTFAAYLHLSHPTGEKSARTVASPDGLLIVGLGRVGPAVGRRDHRAPSSSSKSPLRALPEVRLGPSLREASFRTVSRCGPSTSCR